MNTATRLEKKKGANETILVKRWSQSTVWSDWY